jgi:hypothetical protein
MCEALGSIPAPKKKRQKNKNKKKITRGWWCSSVVEYFVHA